MNSNILEISSFSYFRPQKIEKIKWTSKNPSRQLSLNASKRLVFLGGTMWRRGEKCAKLFAEATFRKFREIPGYK